ncbi:hypothetical protein Tco_0008065 [Tanacetum coccineum]
MGSSPANNVHAWEYNSTLEATHIEFFSDEDESKVDLGTSQIPIQLNQQALLKLYPDSSWVESQCRKNCSISKLQQGHRQEEGIDYEEVFALVARIEAIRLIYVTQPPGFKDPDTIPDKVLQGGQDKVMRLDSVHSQQGTENSTARQKLMFVEMTMEPKYNLFDQIFILEVIVGNEAVHKELGDRMERDATTTSSLEAEQDSESDGYTEIIDFLKASSVHYALTVNPIIYTSCIEQFWATAKVQTVNGVRQLQALVDKKRVIVTESSIRRDLYLDDAEGTDCLPTVTIFEELARMGAGKDFSGRITPLFDTMMVQASEEVGEDSDHPTDSTQIPILDQPSTSSKPKKKHHLEDSE